MTLASEDQRWGDWCGHCADRGDPRPVRFPVAMAPDGLANYRCGKCGSEWSCWWALDEEERAIIEPAADDLGDDE